MCDHYSQKQVQSCFANLYSYFLIPEAFTATGREMHRTSKPIFLMCVAFELASPISFSVFITAYSFKILITRTLHLLIILGTIHAR
jgi:hypothetical protein